jgi:catechol 2,3-dioxygenase-like lactoylglutathione lyase family enzyme
MLHHLDLNVRDLARSADFYGRLLPLLGYRPGEAGEGWITWQCPTFYITLVQTAEPYRSLGFHRKRIGVNHLAFHAPSRQAVDDLHGWLRENGVPILYGGPLEMGTPSKPNYAVFFEDPDRLKLEYVYRPLHFVPSEQDISS